MASWPLWESRGSCWILWRDILAVNGKIDCELKDEGRLQIYS